MTRRVIGLWGAVILMAGCAGGNQTVVALQGTQPGSNISGTVTLRETPRGLHVLAQVANAPPGNHAIHVHENGDCGDVGKAAGGHYNPAQVKHGLVTTDGFGAAHAGDFGNLTVGADGRGTLELTVPGLRLRGGQYPIAGRALILHEKPDDFGQPTGNAGGRIACGVISP